MILDEKHPGSEIPVCMCVHGNINQTKGQDLIRMFKACFIAHARDADLTKHRSTIETDVYTLHTVVVRNQKEAVEVIRELVYEKGVQSVLLCPGFTHQNVAEIANEVKGKAGVAVSRADGPSNIISRKARTGR